MPVLDPAANADSEVQIQVRDPNTPNATARPHGYLTAEPGAMSDPNPFADDCDVIVCYGGAKPTDTHLALTIHTVEMRLSAGCNCVDDTGVRRNTQFGGSKANNSGSEFGDLLLRRQLPLFGQMGKKYSFGIGR